MSPPVFVATTEQLASGSPVVVDGAEGRHAATVRRLRPGEEVVLTDGAGLAVGGVVTQVGRDELSVAVRHRQVVPPPEPRLVVVQALPKGDRGERAVEVMTEIGVDEVVPWAAERSVAVWRGERGGKALRRWRTTAREAAKQSRRWWHPVVADLADTPEVAERLRSASLAVVLHESATAPLSDLPVPAAGEVVLVVGPEGGVSEAELAALTAVGARPAHLGPTVLRTSTAGVVAAGIVLSRSRRWASGTASFGGSVGSTPTDSPR
ncbi:MAG: 16S rRNA (uracil(1498)-N(3))-methyltransferase [Actinomycetota bacterium]|nr:16S rRNA (uracil(1498)-N(3))-methyltransferase [Actinomycetota bacterium]MDH4354317.1 16S rRNA (uracil(1498)-N(3))-methyltransferase [Actinomycetota bacterium]MDH5278099.1 16S rRNA (uracil(1498)-N(3))-methyltransferase [Actinomycetota bacterium]